MPSAGAVELAQSLKSMPPVGPKNSGAKPAEQNKKNSQKVVKDEVLERVQKLFQEADSVHREAWWVLAGYRPPLTKSPFGKVSRALLTTQNIKLANKSLFRCDRYKISRQRPTPAPFPQSIAVFEHCDTKLAAKKIADLSLESIDKIKVTFYPYELEEVLGYAAKTLNKSIDCTLAGREKLTKLTCFDWHQFREKDFSIKLDQYVFDAEATNVMVFKGKVYEFLADVRTIQAQVPKKGKITVKEEELYAPMEEILAAEEAEKKRLQEQTKAQQEAIKKAKKDSAAQAAQEAKTRRGHGGTLGGGVRNSEEGPTSPVSSEGGEGVGSDAATTPVVNDGWPTNEDGTPLPVMGEDGNLYYPEGVLPSDVEGMTPPIEPTKEVNPNVR